MPQTAASDQGLHCLPLSQQFSDISAGNKIKMFIFKNEYGMKLRFSNT